MKIIQAYRVIHRRSDTTNIGRSLDRTRKPGRVILYPGHSTTDANALYRVLCTGEVPWPAMVRGEMCSPKHRMLRTLVVIATCFVREL